jgi:hypothetical protein
MTERPTIEPDPDGDTITVLVGGSVAEPERLMLIMRPERGVVRLREWTSADWAATPDERESPVEALYEDVEYAVKSGRSLNLGLPTLRRFLGIR